MRCGGAKAKRVRSVSGGKLCRRKGQVDSLRLGRLA